MTISYLVSQLVDDTLAKLSGTASDEINILGGSGMASSTTDAQDTVSFQFPAPGCVPGVYLSIEDETLYVLGINTSSQSCTVLRGQKGSAPVSHSPGVKILVDPPWPRYAVMEELQAEIRSWGPQVFRIATKSLSVQSGINGYDLGDTDQIYGKKAIYRDPPPYIGGFGIPWVSSGVPSDQSWPQIPGEIRQAMPTTDFPSGNAVIIETDQLIVPSTFWVVYAKPFNVDTWTDSTDVVGTCGVEPSDLDIAPFGAAWRMVAFRSPRRLFTQIAGQPKDEQAVPPLALMQLADQFKATRDSRLGDAEERLMRMFPLEIWSS